MSVFDPEFNDPSENQKKAKQDKWTVLWIFRKIFGHVYDSTGRKNNILMLLYLFSMVGSVSLVGSVFYKKASYEITVVCIDGTTKERARARTTLKSKSDAKNKTAATVFCNKTPIYINADLKPANPLPAPFYYVVFFIIAFFGALYAARHPHMREWALGMVSSFKGNGAPSSFDFEAIKSTIEKAITPEEGKKKEEEKKKEPETKVEPGDI